MRLCGEENSLRKNPHVCYWKMTPFSNYSSRIEQRLKEQLDHSSFELFPLNGVLDISGLDVKLDFTH